MDYFAGLVRSPKVILERCRLAKLAVLGDET